jgi:hypothetical protein
MWDDAADVSAVAMDGNYDEEEAARTWQESDFERGSQTTLASIPEEDE